jgi:hypothetical protein
METRKTGDQAEEDGLAVRQGEPGDEEGGEPDAVHHQRQDADDLESIL